MPANRKGLVVEFKKYLEFVGLLDDQEGALALWLNCFIVFKQDDRRADFDSITVKEILRQAQLVIYLCAIPAVQIDDAVTAIAQALDHAVPARTVCVGDVNFVAAVPAQNG